MWFPFTESLQVAPPSSLSSVSFTADSPNLLGIAFICMHVEQTCNSPDHPKSLQRCEYNIHCLYQTLLFLLSPPLSLYFFFLKERRNIYFGETALPSQ